MRPWIIALLITSLLAGCAGSDSPATADGTDSVTDDPGSGVDDGAGEAGAAAGGSGVDADNVTLVPEITLSALNGTAPLLVDITLGVGVAYEGPWTLTAGEEELAIGNELPATVNATFEEGSHEILFQVLDEGLEAAASLDVAPAPPTGPTDLATTLELSGVFDAGTHPESDPQVLTFEVPEGAYGVSAWVTWGMPEIGEGIVLTDIDTTMEANGQEVASAGSGSYEWLAYQDDAGVPAGEYTITLTPFATGIETPYRAQVIIWHAPVQVATATGSFEGEQNVQGLGEVHAESVALDFAPSAISAHLMWGVGGDPSCGTANAKGADLDFDAAIGGTAALESGNFASCEYDFADAEDGAVLADATSLDVEISPYLAPAADWTLTVWYV